MTLEHITFVNLLIIFFALPILSVLAEMFFKKKKTIIIIKLIVSEFKKEMLLIRTSKYLFLLLVAIPHRFWIKIPKTPTKLSVLREYFLVIVPLLLSFYTISIVFFMIFITLYLVFVFIFLTNIIEDKSDYRMEGISYFLPKKPLSLKIFTKIFFGNPHWF